MKIVSVETLEAIGWNNSETSKGEKTMENNDYNPKCARCGLRPPGECYEYVDSRVVCYSCMGPIDWDKVTV